MQQFKTALFLIVCGLYAASAAGADCTDDGYYVDEEDCQKYYRCDEGRRFEYRCPVGLKFDTDSFVCVWPNNANCVNSGIKQTTSKPNPSPEPAEPTAECPNGDGFSVDENDCSRFYGCSGGIRHYISCPEGLLYNGDSHSCVEPDQAKCSN